MNLLDTLKKYNGYMNKYSRQQSHFEQMVELPCKFIDQQNTQDTDWIMARVHKLDSDTIITAVLLNNGDCYTNKVKQKRTEFNVHSVLTKYKSQKSNKAWFRSSFPQQHLKRDEDTAQWIQRMYDKFGYNPCYHLGKVTIAQLRKDTK
jgi:tRNA splicing ligase